MLQVNMPWRRTVVELVDSEDESWLNQPKFMLSESDSDSDDSDSGIGVAYIEAVAAMKKVTLSKCKANLPPRQGIVSSQVENRESPALAPDWLRFKPADGTLTETPIDAPVSLLHTVQNKSQPTLPHPSASQRSTAEAAQSPPQGAQSTARMKASSNDVSNRAVSEAVPVQQPSTPTVVAPAAVSTHDMSQLVLKQPQLATAEGSQPSAAAAAPKMDSPSAATISEAEQPQLTTPEEGQPQPAVPQFLDLLFPPEQLPALPRNSPSSSPADSSAVPESQVLHVHTGADHAAVADISAVTNRSSTVLPGTTDILTDASTAAMKMPTVAPVAERGPPLNATTAVGRSSLDSPAALMAAAGPVSTANAGSIACVTATDTAPAAPLAAASHSSRPALIAASGNGAVQDAAAAAVTTTHALPGISSASEAVQAAQPASSTPAAQPAKALGTFDTGLHICQPAEPAAVPSVTVSMLTQLAQQIAQALADAAIQLVPQQQQKQQLQPPSKKPQKQQQQQLKQEQQTLQLQQHCLQQHRLQQPHQQEQQQQQQQQQQQEQQQQILAAASSRELVAALSADASGAALAACLAMTKPAVPASASCPGLLPVPAVSMATDTPESAGLSPPALSSASASAASAPAAAAAAAHTMLPSYSLPQKPVELHSGNSTQPEAVAWPSSGTWPGNRTHKPPLLPGAVPPVRLGPPPPVRLGPPAAPVLTAPVPRPPPVAWPQLPAWPPQWPPLPWGQPPPAPASQYLRPVIAPPAPPPGSPPPQLASGSAASPQPSLLVLSREVVTSASAASAPAPAMPFPSLAQKLKELHDGDGTRSEAVAWPSSGTWPGSRTHKPPLLNGAVPSNAHLPSRPQKRKGLAQQQKPAAKRQKAPVGSGRGPHQRADSAGSVGSVNSNASSSKEAGDHPELSSKKSPAVANRSSGGGQTASTAARLGKRFRQKLRRKSKLAECAQQAYAVASGKVLPGLHAVPYGQRDHGQLPKSQGKKGKGKGQVHRPAQSQKGKKGLSWNPRQSKP